MSIKKETKKKIDLEGLTTRTLMAMADDVVDNYKSAIRVRQGFETLAREHGVTVVFD